MHAASFLSQVARYYANQPDLAEYCFVFPNQRSRQFFFKELVPMLRIPARLPSVCDGNEFVASITRAVPVGGLEAAFCLYEAYRQVMGDRASSFDHFIFWADIILNDFNDVDRALVDPHQLYTNLSNLRDINTDYIPDDLKREIRRIFNIDLPLSGDRFWKAGQPWKDTVKDSDVKEEYFGLWDAMQSIYEVFHRQLEQRGLTTTGHMMRNAVKIIAGMAPEEMRHKRVVFVGFGLLSMSEIMIFKSLQAKGVAHFWWDDASPAFDNGNNPGGAMIKGYARMFPSPAALEPLQHEQNIRAIKVPSHVGQAKYAFQEVLRVKQGAPGDLLANAIDTAIVLPDEALLLPLVNAVPPAIEKLNITLGYPLRLSGIVSLMRIVAKAHKQAGIDGTTGHSVYYREDVKDMLSHPIIKAVFGQEALRLGMQIEWENKFNIDAAFFDGTGLQPLMATVPASAHTADVLAYLDRLTEFTRALMLQVQRHDNPTPDDSTLPLQAAFIEQYAGTLAQLRQCIERHGVPVADNTLFYLIDRLTSTPIVPFSGEPLQGLQVMGVLETRNLDFDNIIVLSMNERVFPRKHTINSMIPNDFRRAFYMSTHEQQEALSTYYFYRMISRAGNVSLIYDSSSLAIGSNEPSRFITQLERIYRQSVEHINVKTDISSFTELAISVGKRPQHMLPYGGGTPKRYLSASSINEYINCPLKFYLRHVEGLSDDNEATDFMGYDTFGDIVHETLKELYFTLTEPSGHKITGPMITDYLKNKMRPTVMANINRIYLHNPDPESPLRGDAYILLDTIVDFVRRALQYDLKLLPDPADYIEVLECEVDHSIDNMVLPGGNTHFNFTFKADRIDCIHSSINPQPMVRIIDYKTGQDATTFSDIAQLCDSSLAKRPKALLQLMLYCNAYHHVHPEYRRIEPMIMKLRKIDESGMTFKPSQKAAMQYVFSPDDELNLKFAHNLDTILGHLFSLDTPFTQTEQPKNHCRFCHFADLCRR